jgi:hypothetical protein
MKLLIKLINRFGSCLTKIRERKFYLERGSFTYSEKVINRKSKLINVLSAVSPFSLLLYCPEKRK